MTRQHGIVVGYDGSDFSLRALEWATEEAESRKLPLTVTYAWRWPYSEADGEAKLHLGKAAEHVLLHGAKCAHAHSPIVEVITDLHEGSAAQRLVELSDNAHLLVVGAHNRGMTARFMIGSVAAFVAARARSPVIIVREAGPAPVLPQPKPVLLGVKDTTADAVLDFAFQEAALRNLPLRVMHAGHPRPMAWGIAMAHAPDLEDSARACRERVQERLIPWRRKYADVRLDVASATTAPRDALLAASAEAALVVVGTGRTASRTGHLGTITGSLVRHASCPVAVVPSQEHRSSPTPPTDQARAARDRSR
ncbi:universal stress protein [Streptosporangium sp. NPDC023963]|uniref:universal stress protein n=1 Tax=Streptosporangium sp. NPDC023963 TaxID=3155608 RepID=UPI0034155A28